MVARHAKKHIGGFLGFVREQGVIGLAVGLAVGVAAKETVDSIVDGLINPLVGFILAGRDLTNITWNTGLQRDGKFLEFALGNIANSMISLLAVAAVVYFLIKGFRLDKLDKKKD